MNVETLRTKKVTAEQAFNSLEKQRLDIIEEQGQLRGEFRLIVKLIDEIESEPPQDPAVIIDAEPLNNPKDESDEPE